MCSKGWLLSPSGPPSLCRAAALTLCRVTPQDVILQNKHLWLLLKAWFGYQSKSQYRKWQRMLQTDPNWPPANTKDLAAKSTEEIYINPTYEHSNED